MAMMGNPYAATTLNQDPYPTPKWLDTIGGNLGTALFGDPRAAAEMRLRQAQGANFSSEAEKNRSDAAKLDAETQATQAETRTRAALPGLFNGAYTQVPDTASYGAPDASGVMAVHPADIGTHRAVDPVGLANLLGALVGAKVADPKGYVGALGAFAGSDEDARRAMVAQGVNPSENFAITPGRADQIAATRANADAADHANVANINGGYGVKEAGIHAGAEVQSAGISAGASRYGSDRQFQAATRDTDVKDATERWKIDQASHGKGPKTFSPGQLGNIDKEINAQLGAAPLQNALPSDLQGRVRARAIDIAGVTGNPASAVAQAVSELVQSTPKPGFFPGAFGSGPAWGSGTTYAPKVIQSGSAPHKKPLSAYGH